MNPANTIEKRAKEISAFISEIENSMSERDYQRDFYESLCDQFERIGRLSEKQFDALKKIYDRVTDVAPERFYRR